MAEVIGNRAIEDAAIAWVIERERATGRRPIDRRADRTFSADIDLGDGMIEVKAYGSAARGSDLWLEVSQVEEALRNPGFRLYIVENVRQGDPALFTCRVFEGERLIQLLARAREARYFQVPLPVAEYDSAPQLAAAPRGSPAHEGSVPDVEVPMWRALRLLRPPSLGMFGGVVSWAGDAKFERWPVAEPPSHEINCRKGSALLVGADGEVSCAEVEVVRWFRSAGWNAGWLATCGRRNATWRQHMVAVRQPTTSVLSDPVLLLPGRVASLVARQRASGYPDVVAWQSERKPVFVELKGPGDSGTAQAHWLQAALEAETIQQEDFLLVRWTT